MLLGMKMDLDKLCAPGDRRQAVERLLMENGIRHQRVRYAGEGVNYIISFGDMWNWDKVYCAHYDRVPGAPGANDNGASVTCLIQLASHLQSEGYCGSLAIVLFDKEEPCNRDKGGPGSRWFGKQLTKRDHQPELLIVLDVIGRGDVLFHDDWANPSMVDIVESVIPDIESKATPGSDDVILGMEGIDSLLLCAIPHRELDSNSPVTWAMLHTECDSIDTVDLETIDWVFRVLCELTKDAPQIVEGIAEYEDVNTLPLWEEVRP